MDNIESWIDYYAAEADFAEEAIAENADVVLAKLAELTAHPERAADIAASLHAMIRSHVEPIARRKSEAPGW
jgi:hypothetical protein